MSSVFLVVSIGESGRLGWLPLAVDSRLDGASMRAVLLVVLLMPPKLLVMLLQ